MCCIPELAMLVFGVFTLVNGSFRMSQEKVVWGVPARIMGALLLVPMPLEFVIFFTTVFAYTAQGRPLDPENLRWLVLTNAGIVLGTCVLILVIGLTAAEPVEGKKSPRDGEYEGDDVPNSGE
jgi:cation transporter-like permease